MEIALVAFKCLKRCLPPKKMREFHFRCGLHSFLTHVKSAIDNFSEEINLLYEIDATLAGKGKTMSIGKLLKNKENKKKLRQKNHQLFIEISKATKTKWFTDLTTLRNEEAVHGAISGKKWQAIIGGGSPIVKLGMKDVSDFATWCPHVLKETNNFLEKCYQQI